MKLLLILFAVILLINCGNPTGVWYDDEGYRHEHKPRDGGKDADFACAMLAFIGMVYLTKRHVLKYYHVGF